MWAEAGVSPGIDFAQEHRQEPQFPISGTGAEERARCGSSGWEKSSSPGLHREGQALTSSVESALQTGSCSRNVSIDEGSRGAVPSAAGAAAAAEFSALGQSASNSRDAGHEAKRAGVGDFQHSAPARRESAGGASSNSSGGSWVGTRETGGGSCGKRAASPAPMKHKEERNRTTIDPCRESGLGSSSKRQRGVDDLDPTEEEMESLRTILEILPAMTSPDADAPSEQRLLEVLREKQQNMEEALEALSQEWLAERERADQEMARAMMEQGMETLHGTHEARDSSRRTEFRGHSKLQGGSSAGSRTSTNGAFRRRSMSAGGTGAKSRQLATNEASDEAGSENDPPRSSSTGRGRALRRAEEHAQEVSGDRRAPHDSARGRCDRATGASASGEGLAARGSASLVPVTPGGSQGRLDPTLAGSGDEMALGALGVLAVGIAVGTSGNGRVHGSLGGWDQAQQEASDARMARAVQQKEQEERDAELARQEKQAAEAAKGTAWAHLIGDFDERTTRRGGKGSRLAPNAAAPPAAAAQVWGGARHVGSRHYQGAVKRECPPEDWRVDGAIDGDGSRYKEKAEAATDDEWSGNVLGGAPESWVFYHGQFGLVLPEKSAAGESIVRLQDGCITRLCTEALSAARVPAVHPFIAPQYQEFPAMDGKPAQIRATFRWEAKVECEFHCSRFRFRYTRFNEIEYHGPESELLAELARDARAQPGCALKQQLVRGVTHRVEVFDAGSKGFGVRARENIELGVAVMEYVGENVPAHAMGERDLQAAGGDSTYIFDVKIGTEKTHGWLIDARRVGNVARFVNHGCFEKANVKPKAFAADQSGKLPKRVALVSTRKIFLGEELLYDYGDSTKPTAKRTRCHCGSGRCNGWVR